MNALPEPHPSPNPGPLAPWLAPAGETPRRWLSHELLGGAREVEIEHQGAVYRLKVTSLGKLILTK